MNFDFVVGAVRVESVWDGEGKWKRFQNDETEEYDANIARNLFEYPGLSETDLVTGSSLRGNSSFSEVL